MSHPSMLQYTYRLVVRELNHNAYHKQFLERKYRVAKEKQTEV